MSSPRAQLLAATDGLNMRWYSNWDSLSIAGRGVFCPRFVMLHHTAGTNSLGPLVSSDDLTTGPNKGKVPGAHFLVNRDGSVTALTWRVAYHAGKGRGFGVPTDGMNPYAWGIEIEDLGMAQTMTDAQIDAVARLTAGLLRAMGKGLDAVIQHKEWSTTGKPDTRYSTDFWRSRVDAYLNPPTHTEEPDMDTTTSMKVPTWGRAAIGADEITVQDAFLRTLTVAKRTEVRMSALLAALEAVGPGVSLAEVQEAARAGAAMALADMGIAGTPPAV